jgi:hypothetical protein
VSNREHASGCQCNRCVMTGRTRRVVQPDGSFRYYYGQPSFGGADCPPKCASCGQHLTWLDHDGWTLWGWAGRGMNEQDAARCVISATGRHQAEPQSLLSGAGTLAVSDGTRFVTRCRHCSADIWREGAMWARHLPGPSGSPGSHFLCERNPGAYNVHEPPPGVAAWFGGVPQPQCTMGTGCQCPFHRRQFDEAMAADMSTALHAAMSPLLGPSPRNFLREEQESKARKDRARLAAERAAAKQAQARKPRKRLTLPERQDRMYAEVTGRPLPQPGYDGWRDEFILAGKPYALERMRGYVTLDTAEPNWVAAWDDPVGDERVAKVLALNAAKVPELSAAASLARASAGWPLWRWAWTLGLLLLTVAVMGNAPWLAGLGAWLMAASAIRVHADRVRQARARDSRARERGRKP